MELKRPPPAASVMTMERISQLSKPRCISSCTLVRALVPERAISVRKMNPQWLTTAMRDSGLQSVGPPHAQRRSGAFPVRPNTLPWHALAPGESLERPRVLESMQGPVCPMGEGGSLLRA